MGCVRSRVQVPPARPFDLVRRFFQLCYLKQNNYKKVNFINDMDKKIIDKKYPRIGVGVMIQNEQGQVLLGLRKGSHGAGDWSFPGGHLDSGEKLFQAAIRETEEETGMRVGEVEIISISDDLRYIASDDKHYVTIGVKVSRIQGEPQLKEPDKCKAWQWFDLNELPENIFEPTGSIIENYKNQRLYKS